MGDDRLLTRLVRGKHPTTGFTHDASVDCRSSAWPDVRKRIERSGFRASHSQSAVAGSAYTDALVARRVVRACDAVLDGRIDAAESSTVATVRAFERVCMAV